MNPQTRYATTTQVLPRLKAMSLPVTMVAAELMAARTAMKMAVRTTRSTAKEANREANPA